MPGKHARAGNGPDPPWDLREIERLIDLLTARQITEFEMERNGLRIRIRRGGAPVESSAAPLVPATPSPTPVHLRVPAVTVASAASAPAVQAEASGEAVLAEPAPKASTEELHIIKSPIVGTFFSAPSPNAPPFVQLGDVVEVGQVLCIIEAMKLMNEIESEAAGEIVQIYIENGQAVEYGQSLFAIKPASQK